MEGQELTEGHENIEEQEVEDGGGVGHGGMRRGVKDSQFFVLFYNQWVVGVSKKRVVMESMGLRRARTDAQALH